MFPIWWKQNENCYKKNCYMPVTVQKLWEYLSKSIFHRITQNHWANSQTPSPAPPSVTTRQNKETVWQTECQNSRDENTVEQWSTCLVCARAFIPFPTAWEKEENLRVRRGTAMGEGVSSGNKKCLRPYGSQLWVISTHFLRGDMPTQDTGNDTDFEQEFLHLDK